MSKATAALQAQIDALTAQSEKQVKELERLREIAYRHESQIARHKINVSEAQRFYEDIKDLYLTDFWETAISIFEWKKLPKTARNVLNSKRIERQISQFGKVVLFKHTYPLLKPNGENSIESQFLVLPFNGVSGSLDCYGEYQVIKPYSPSGTIAPATDWPELIVGQNCVVLTDFYQWAQTNANNSLSIRWAIEVYASLIAECELVKKINRNYLKLPFMFDSSGLRDRNEYNKMVAEIEALLCGVQEGAPAIISKYINELRVVPTGSVYFGEQLTQTIKQYQNDLYNYLGIGHIRNENRARKITAEFEEIEDEYNINITKRLQLRKMAAYQMREIWTEFKEVYVDVTLAGYKNYNDAGEEDFDEPNQGQEVRRRAVG